MKKKINKPWGHEILLEKNKYYVLKELFMKKNHQCSLQYHKKKKETLYILRGRLLLIYSRSKNKFKKKILYSGNSFTLAPGIIHRMKGLTNSTYLEASTPQLKDVVRIEDDYKRV